MFEFRAEAGHAVGGPVAEVPHFAHIGPFAADRAARVPCAAGFTDAIGARARHQPRRDQRVFAVPTHEAHVGYPQFDHGVHVSIRIVTVLGIGTSENADLVAGPPAQRVRQPIARHRADPGSENRASADQHEPK